MHQNAKRTGFTLTEMLVVITIFCMLLALLVPVISAAREAARRDGCLNNIRQLALCAVSYEGSNGVWPLLGDSPQHPQAAVEGSSTAGEVMGYGVLIKFLPYMEENILYGEIRLISRNFQAKTPFDPAISTGANPAIHVSRVPMPGLRCPTFSGPRLIDLDGYTSNPYSDLGGAPALTNYVALTGSISTVAGDNVEQDGVVVSKCAEQVGSPGVISDCSYKGHTLDQIEDGTSKTFLFCESRERTHASWYDSASSWVIGGVGVKQTTGNQGIVGTSKSPSTPIVARHFLNRGGLKMIPSSAPTTGEYWHTATKRRWGASSEHSGNVVIHIYADVHTKSIHQSMDAYLYLQHITRSGGEK